MNDHLYNVRNVLTNLKEENTKFYDDLCDAEEDTNKSIYLRIYDLELRMTELYVKFCDAYEDEGESIFKKVNNLNDLESRIKELCESMRDAKQKIRAAYDAAYDAIEETRKQLRR